MATPVADVEIALVLSHDGGASKLGPNLVAMAGLAKGSGSVATGVVLPLKRSEVWVLRSSIYVHVDDGGKRCQYYVITMTSVSSRYRKS